MTKEKPMWVNFNVTLKLRDKLVGGYPKNPEAEAAMLKARGLEDLIPPPVDPTTLSEEDQKALKEQAIAKSATGFKSNGQGLYLESRQIKAMLKEAANVTKVMLGLKNMKSKIAERVFIEPTEIYLGKDRPDGTDTRIVHAMTMQGPRSSLKFCDFILQPEVSFRLRTLNDGLITGEYLRTLLEYAQENGLGADRSQDFGKFDVIKFEAI